MEEAADAAPTALAPRSSALRYYASAAQAYAAERAVCACLKRLVSEASGPRVSGCLPRFRARTCAEFTARAVTTDVRALPPMLKMMLNKRRPGI